MRNRFYLQDWLLFYFMKLISISIPDRKSSTNYHIWKKKSVVLQLLNNHCCFFSISQQSCCCGCGFCYFHSDVISGFKHGVNEICALLGFYAASVGGFLPTFRHNIWWLWNSASGVGEDSSHLGRLALPTVQSTFILRADSSRRRHFYVKLKRP